MKTLAQIYADLVIEHGPHVTDKGGAHSYLSVYADAFAPLRDQSISLLEVGVQYGSSLALWKRYFSRARVTGIDPRPDLKVDVQDAVVLADDVWKKVMPPSAYDIIIDDGDHTVAGQLMTFSALHYSLKEGGLYFIEDVYGHAAWALKRSLPRVRLFDLRALDQRADSMLVQVLTY